MLNFNIYQILISISLVVSTNIYSQTIKNTKAFSFKDQVSVDFNSSYNSSLHRNSDEDKSIDMDFEVAPSLILANGMKVSGKVSGNKDFLNEREFILNDTWIKLSDKILTFKAVNLSGGVKVYLPTSEKSRDVKQLNGAFATSVGLSAPILSWGLAIAYGLRYKYIFYQYEVALDGNSNYEYSVGNSLSLTYKLNDQFSISSVNAYKRAFTHLGYTKDQYLFSQELAMMINTNLSVFTGHSNGGNPLAASGDHIDINITDSRESIVYMGLTVSI